MSVIGTLMERLGGRYSSTLGIDLSRGTDEEIFKWFLASKLYAARIGEDLATRTYHEFKENNLLTPKEIIEAGWENLVKVLDDGGYVRYDFSTATKLLEIMKDLINKYSGSLNRLHEESKDEKEISERLKGLGKGIGEVTVNIFLRELRGIWRKVDPAVNEFSILAARRLGILTESDSGKDVPKKLKEYWRKNRIKDFDFSDFEAALLRLGKNYIRKKKDLGWLLSGE
ncbi:TPA: hypothetical protein DCX15_03165 [bacterium]|nr:hypothetical protein [bacterium]